MGGVSKIFTGIVEEVGSLCEIVKESDLYTLKINAKKVLIDTKMGDSICTNGVCLTVCDIGENFFTAEAILETFNNTTFKNLKVGDNLNLERALSLNERLGGHIVQGHIDGVGKILNIINRNHEIVFSIEFFDDNFKYIVEKGSVTLDGISLTVSKVLDFSFNVSIIPTTIHETTLKYKNVGDYINIETDILGRYVESLLNVNKKSSISLEFLRENGF